MIIPTDGFYSKTLEEGEDLYDAATIQARGVKKLRTDDIENGAFRNQLDIPEDTPVIIIASHLPREGEVDTSLFNQGQVNQLIFVSAYESQSHRKLTGQEDIIANNKVWMITDRLLNPKLWFSGVLSREGRPKLELEIFTRRRDYYPLTEPGALSQPVAARSGEELVLLAGATKGVSLTIIFEIAASRKKENAKKFGELIDSSKKPVTYQFPLRKPNQKNVPAAKQLIEAETVSADDLLNLLTSYLGMRLPRLDVLIDIYMKTSFTLDETREFWEILDRHTHNINYETAAENEEIKAYFEARLKYRYPGVFTPSGQMKSLGIRDPLDEDAELDLSFRHPDFESLAASVPLEDVFGTQARVVEADLGNAGAYHFTSIHGLIIIVDSKYPQIREEGKYHEVREIYWMGRGFTQHEAHVIASAEQVQKFSQNNSLTPYHLSQIQNMSPEQLQALADEDENARQWHHEVLKRTQAAGADIDLIKIAAYEDMLRENAATAFGTPSSKNVSPTEDKLNTGGIDFRVLPLTIMPITSFFKQNLNPSLLDINLSEEWRQIENLVQGGILPSGQRLKEYVQASYQKRNLNDELPKVILCLAEITRLEEETPNTSHEIDKLIDELLVILGNYKEINQD